MPTSEELTDSYLAALLSKEADKVGGGNIRPTARPRDAPKPNLRFLRHLIKDTDSHNAVLIERERQLAADGSKRARKAQRDDDFGDGRPSKRQRTERPNKWASALGHAALKKRNEKSSHRREPSHDRQARRHALRDARSRSHSPDREQSSRPRHHDRSERTYRRISSSGRSDIDHEQRTRDRQPPERSHQSKAKHEDSDTDPLEAIVGPRLPPRTQHRGRGATGEASGIDLRFTDPDYNPTKDIQRDDNDDDDWHMALSAIQDRAKWRAVGADRLRAAGFTEADVQKWEGSSKLAAPKSADEDIDNVVWRGRGEKRDWDLGKVLDVDGDVVTKAPWTINQPG